jgi:hypothetical protein
VKGVGGAFSRGAPGCVVIAKPAKRRRGTFRPHYDPTRMLTSARYIEAPRRLRAFVRAHESSLIVLTALVGTIGGLVVAAMSAAVKVLHVLLFNLEMADRL